mmetsp:Transcript_1932/g.2778  ORF Transcript_1932/g.2778 Transcript_1932/m.2778 type:complete len:99 (-) Transcript_1932:2130-2426(-)
MFQKLIRVHSTKYWLTSLNSLMYFNDPTVVSFYIKRVLTERVFYKIIVPFSSQRWQSLILRQQFQKSKPLSDNTLPRIPEATSFFQEAEKQMTLNLYT